MVQEARERSLKIAAGAMLALLAACGGGGGAGSTATPPPMLASGQSDPSYGSAGRALLSNLSIFSPGIFAVAPGGSAYVTGSQVQKLDENGALVASFATNGQAAVRSRAPLLDAAENVYYIGGDTTFGWRGIYALDPDGRPLSSFGINGLAGLTSLGGDRDGLVALGRDGDGNIYLAGTRVTFEPVISTAAVVAKFDRNGRLDTAYGAAGLAAIVVTGLNLAVSTLAVDAAGNAFVAGSATDSTGVPRAFVAKVAPNGRLAPGFGNPIWVDNVCPQARASTANAVALDAAGSLLIGGSCVVPDASFPRAALYKLDVTGVVPLSFRFGSTGAGGLFGPEAPAFPSVVNAVIIANGAIYAAGTATRDPARCPDVAIAKVDASLNTAPSFGENGVALIHAGTDSLEGAGVDALGRVYALDAASTCLATPASLGAMVFRLGG